MPVPEKIGEGNLGEYHLGVGDSALVIVVEKSRANIAQERAQLLKNENEFQNRGITRKPALGLPICD